VLYRTIHTHLETFVAQTAGDADRSGLPGPVKREFEALTICTTLPHHWSHCLVNIPHLLFIHSATVDCDL
jgi:hypothetical protein